MNMRVHTAIVLTLCVLIGAGCGGRSQEHVARLFESSELYASGIAAVTASGKQSFLMIDFENGSITRAYLDDWRGETMIYAPNPARGLRVRVLPTLQQIWVLRTTGLSVFPLSDLDKGEGLTPPEVANTPEAATYSRSHCFPDLALDNKGNAYFSSAIRPALWRVTQSLTWEPMALKLMEDSEVTFGFSALAYSARDQILYAASAATGALWKIDLTTLVTTKIRLDVPLRGACELLLDAAQEQRGARPLLYVTQPFRGIVSVIELDAERRSGVVTRLMKTGDRHTPLGLAQAKDGSLVMTDARILRHRDFADLENETRKVRVHNTSLTRHPSRLNTPQ